MATRIGAVTWYIDSSISACIHSCMIIHVSLNYIVSNKLKSSLNGSQIIFWNLHCLFIMNVLIHVSWNIVDVRFIVVQLLRKQFKGDNFVCTTNSSWSVYIIVSHYMYIFKLKTCFLYFFFYNHRYLLSTYIWNKSFIIYLHCLFTRTYIKLFDLTYKKKWERHSWSKWWSW